MTKIFTRLQLFSIVDGRLANTIDDVYSVLNHVCDTELMTHHLPVAYDYLKKKNPKWLQVEQNRLDMLRARLATNRFESLIGYIKDHPEEIEIPQLKDEFFVGDFEQHMISNSLLLKMKK